MLCGSSGSRPGPQACLVGSSIPPTCRLTPSPRVPWTKGSTSIAPHSEKSSQRRTHSIECPCCSCDKPKGECVVDEDRGGLLGRGRCQDSLVGDFEGDQVVTCSNEPLRGPMLVGPSSRSKPNPSQPQIIQTRRPVSLLLSRRRLHEGGLLFRHWAR